MQIHKVSEYRNFSSSDKHLLRKYGSLGIICSLMLFPATPWASESCRKDTLSEYGFALVAHVYKSFFADRLVSCYMSCSMQPACQSLNYNLADKTCEFNNDTKYFRSKYFVEKPTFVYAENPDSGKFESFFLHLESKKLRYLFYHSLLDTRECRHCNI